MAETAGRRGRTAARPVCFCPGCGGFSSSLRGGGWVGGWVGGSMRQRLIRVRKDVPCDSDLGTGGEINQCGPGTRLR